MIPQSRPYLSREDFSYIEEILGSHQVARGVLTDALEKDFAEALGVRHAMAVSHGTAALHLALLALGIREGDEVIVPSYSCASLLHAVHYTGANAVLTDIDVNTFNPTAELIRPRLTARTKAVILTHTFGFPADLDSISRLGVPIIEDCAQALGARYQRKPVGTFGRISIFSFYATKMICSGEGGMVCTDEDKLAERLRDLNTPDQRSTYRVRYNYKMSDLTAGLALSQFKQLQGFIQRRREIAERYRQALSRFPLRMQAVIENSDPVYYRFVVRTEHASAFSRKTRKAGIVCDRPIFRPLHYYTRAQTLNGLENTDCVWKSGISIPLYPDLSEAEISRIISVATEAFARLSKSAD